MYTMNIHSICKHYIYIDIQQPGGLATSLTTSASFLANLASARVPGAWSGGSGRHGEGSGDRRMLGEWLVNGWWMAISSFIECIVGWFFEKPHVFSAWGWNETPKWTYPWLYEVFWGVFMIQFFFEWCPNRWIKHVDGGVGFLVVSGFEQVVHFEGADRAPQSTWRITEIVTGELRGL